MSVTIAHWKTAASGSFNVAANWSTAVVPNANDDAVLDAAGSAYAVTSSANNTVDFLGLSANATLNVTAGTFAITCTAGYFNLIASAGTINVGAGAVLSLARSGTGNNELYNTGSIAISTTGAAAELRIAAPRVDLEGGGTLTLSGAAAQIIGTATATIFDNRDNTITGSGRIGSASLTLYEDPLGIINANASGLLTLYTGTNQILSSGTIETTGTGGMTISSNLSDSGALIAGGTGALTISAATVSGGGGSITAAVAKASIRLSNGVLSTSGIITTVAGSSIAALAGTTDRLSTGDMENAGAILVANGATLLMDAFVNNTGSIQVAGGTSKTTIEIDPGNSGLEGTGQVLLSNSANNSIVSSGAQVQLTNRSTIAGAGTIGDADLRFVNLTGGVVNANGSVGLTMIGDSASGESTDYSNGLMEATGTGGMTIEGTWGNGGTMAAIGTGALTFLNATITSGGGLTQTTRSGASIVLNNSAIGGGTMVLVAGSTLTLAAGTTDSITEEFHNAGVMHIANGATLVTSPTHWVGTGTVDLDGTSAATTLEVGSSTTGAELQLVGGGTINLGGAENSIVSDGSAAGLRNINGTIAGAGTIGDANLTVNNASSGVIIANGASVLTIATGSNVVFNAGTIETNAAAGLTIAGTLHNAGRLIANQGLLDVTGDVDNDGLAQINNAAAIEVGGYDASDVTFASGSSGTFRLDNSTTAADAFGGRITGFAGQAKIDLSDIAYTAGTTSVSYSGNTLDGFLKVANGTTSSSLHMIGSYTTASFTLGSDSHGGTLVSFV